MSRSQPAENRSNRSMKQLVGSAGAAAGIGTKRLLLCVALDYDTLLKSTSESADRENTCELLRGNIVRIGAERLSCTELTTNLYRASRSATMTFIRICTTMSRRSMARTLFKGLVSA